MCSFKSMLFYNGTEVSASRCLVETGPPAYCVGQEKDLPRLNKNSYSPVMQSIGESLYRVIHKSLRDFRTRLRNNQDRHGRKEHINR